MFISQVNLENYRNVLKVNLQLKGKVTLFFGLNGMGKTNLLDGISFLCNAKSNFLSNEQLLINTNSDFLATYGVLQGIDEKTFNIRVAIARERKKIIKKDDELVEKVSDYFGHFPTVIISPSQMSLIEGLAEDRRRWLDATLSNIDNKYLKVLSEYNKILMHRNSYLKNAEGRLSLNDKLLETYSEKLVNLGNYIYEIRSKYFIEIKKYFENFYEFISKSKNEVNIEYDSQLHKKSFKDLMKRNIQSDIIVGRTQIGIHKDDLQFSIKNYPLRKIGSQGQLKTSVIALKLTEYEVISNNHPQKPILLLDDICDRLDKERLSSLFQYIDVNNKIEQIFITDTDKNRLGEFLNINHSYKIKDGCIEE